MKKKNTFLLLLLVFNCVKIFAGGGIWEYYLNTKYNSVVKNHGNYSGGTNFDGSVLSSSVSLGSDNLAIDLAGVKTWQDNGTSFTALALWYRVYLQGSSAPAFTSVNLPWFADLGGNNNKEWQNGNDINLLSGLSSAGTYVVEVFFQGTYTGPTADNNGYLSNGGSNYKATFVAQVVLPTVLSKFNAQLEEGNAALNWTLDSKFNIKTIIIEKSFDAQKWLKVDAVAINENNNYSYIDKNLTQSSKIYYRLKMVDYDESFTYSNIVTLTNQKTAEIMIYPNPTVDIINIKNNNSVNNTIEIYNTLGLLVKQQKSDANYVDVHDLPRGNYFLMIKDDNKAVIYHTKINKQ